MSGYVSRRDSGHLEVEGMEVEHVHWARPRVCCRSGCSWQALQCGQSVQPAEPHWSPSQTTRGTNRSPPPPPPPPVWKFDVAESPVSVKVRFTCWSKRCEKHKTFLFSHHYDSLDCAKKRSDHYFTGESSSLYSCKFKTDRGREINHLDTFTDIWT